MSAGRARLLLVAWVALVYSTLGVARPVAAALRERNLLTWAIVAIALVVGLAALRLLQRDGREQRVVPWVPVVLTAAGYGALATCWGLPEERFHLVEYALVGLLISRALRGRLIAGLLLGAAIGATEEALQLVLPIERVFDVWDIVANVTASTAALLLAAGGRLSWAAPLLLFSVRLVLPMVHSTATMEGPAEAPVEATPVVELPEPDLNLAPATEAPGLAPVLLITIDALRQDHAPPWGDPPVPTPSFDRLARESVTFDEVFANSIWTTPGVQSLLTGLLPEVHGVQARGHELPQGPVFPLEQLQNAGYRTLGFAGDDSETYRHLGFDRELDREGDLLEQVVTALGQDGPSFVWLHLRDIHAPYDASGERLAELGLEAAIPSSPILDRARSHALIPRRDFPGRHDWLRPAIRALYAAEVADADERLGRLLARLEETRLLDRVVLVLTADHGEELLEHHGIGHASTTLDSAPQPELVEIPLYLRLPSAARGGSMVRGRFEQVDLMPTLFSLLQLPLTEASPGVGLDGRDWAPPVLAPTGEAPPARPAVASSTPCGWQCPPERRGERVHARVAEGWDWCRPPQAPCSPALSSSLEEQHRRAVLLRAE